MTTSDPLLPTPTARDYKGGTPPGRQGSPGLVNVLTSSRAVSPVSLLVQLDLGVEQLTNAIYGPRCLELYDLQNLHGSLLKTCVASLIGTKAWYSSRCALTWKPVVTKSKRLLFQLSPSTPRTGAIGSGLLLTPSVVQTDEEPEKMVARRKRNGYRNGTKWGSLASQIRYGMLPTPDASMGLPGGPLTYDPTSKNQSSRTVNALMRPPGMKTGWKLQPNFAAWMMGYPPNWTDLNSPKPNIETRNSKPTATP